MYLTRVAVCEERADGQQHLGDGKRWAPVVLQNVQADHSLTVNVAVVDPCTERDLSDQEKRQGRNMVRET